VGPTGRENRYPVQLTSGAYVTGKPASHGGNRVNKVAKAAKVTMAAKILKDRAEGAKEVHLRPPHVL
jgi:hypothetical protein